MIMNLYSNKASLGDNVCYYGALRYLNKKYNMDWKLYYDQKFFDEYKNIIKNYETVLNKDNFIKTNIITKKDVRLLNEQFLQIYYNQIIYTPYIEAIRTNYKQTYSKPIILINAFTTQRFKKYNNFSKVLKHIYQNKRKGTIIAIGDNQSLKIPFDKQTLFYIEKYCDINLINKLSLQELVDLIYDSDILLSNDSGPVHLAKCIKDCNCKIITLMPAYFYNKSLAVYNKIEDPKRIDFIIPENIVCNAITAHPIIWDDYIKKYCLKCINPCINQIKIKTIIEKVFEYYD